MYRHEIPDEGYQLILGPWSLAPPPPTWRKFFVSQGIPHRTDSEIDNICSSHFIERRDFDKPMSVRYWEDWFEIEGGPLARAYHLLYKVDLGPERASERGPLLDSTSDHTHQTTSFLLVSGFGAGPYSAKLFAGTRQRCSGLNQMRLVFRILMTGGPPVRSGGGMPHRILTISSPASDSRITGAR
jgi:hypothetical protein